MKKKVIAKDNFHLKKMIKKYTEKYGHNCDLNFIDTSLITNMDAIFMGSFFNGDISKWNVSNVTDMKNMFFQSHFNGDISSWDVSNVEKMTYMFAFSLFRQDLSDWTPYSLKDNVALFSTDMPQDVLPYWAKYEKQTERNLAITHYVEKKALKIKLDDILCDNAEIDKKNVKNKI